MKIQILDGIVKLLGQKNMFNPEFIKNPYRYHNIKLQGEIEWDKEWNILHINYNGQNIK